MRFGSASPAATSPLTAATVSFGHGLAASPLHLASAYATIANDGHRVRPTLVHRKDPVQGEQILSASAAAAARDLLRGVVTRGTAKAAEVKGYGVGGKTGTADKPKPGGGYYKSRVVSTFAAIYPTDKPRYVLVVTLDEPSVSAAGGGEVRTAGATAAPVAAALIQRLSPMLGLHPEGVTLPEIEPKPANAVRLSSK